MILISTRTEEKIRKMLMTSIYYTWLNKRIDWATDIKKGWDGTIKGKPTPVGSYTWMINLADTDGVNQRQNGVVLLTR